MYCVGTIFCQRKPDGKNVFWKIKKIRLGTNVPSYESVMCFKDGREKKKIVNFARLVLDKQLDSSRNGKSTSELVWVSSPEETRQGVS